MTNEELKTTLEQMLRDGEVTPATVATLQDASIHAAMKLKLPLHGVAEGYAVMAAGHEVMVMLETIFGAKETQEEENLFTRLFQDLKIDL